MTHETEVLKALHTGGLKPTFTKLQRVETLTDTVKPHSKFQTHRIMGHLVSLPKPEEFYDLHSYMI